MERLDDWGVEGAKARRATKRRVMRVEGGSCHLKIEDVVRVLSHDPVMDTPRIRLPWPLSKFQAHDVTYVEMTGDTMSPIQKFSRRQIDAAVDYFLRDADLTRVIRFYGPPDVKGYPMQLFAKIGQVLKDRALEKMVRSGSKGCARVFVVSTGALEKKYKGVADTYAWLARKSLESRTQWSRVNETDFVHEPSGTVIAIADDLSVADVVHLVVNTEVGFSLTSESEWKRKELLAVARSEVDKYFG